MRRLTWLVAALLLPALAAATDVPVAGRRLDLRTRSATRRTASITLRDAAIAPPFAPPAAGAALVLSGGIDPGQCRIEIPLDPALWKPIGRDGPNRGWRYRIPSPGTQGVRRVELRRGAIRIKARGETWPCGLDAAQRVPVTVELRTGADRWCAAFGGNVVRNETGRFTARDAAAPAACPKIDLTVAQLNILHGLFCPPATVNCRRVDRVALLFEWLAASGCPDVVTLQEVWDPSVPGLTAGAATACPFPYEVVYLRTNTIDDEMILSRFPVVDVEQLLLLGSFRHVLRARIDHPIGPVDVFTTHLASGSDGANNPCGASCPAECVTAGAATNRQCQAVQMAQFVEQRHDLATPAIVTGDFNAQPGSFEYDQFAGRGWVDSYLAAGNPECNPATGIGCTSGREDQNLSELESPASNESSRIDYAFVVPPGAGSVCSARLDPAADLDGDGTATRIFADTPLHTPCGPAPDPICWPSDHEGAEVDLQCD
jgi:endonuclease/exonuclease/phosphatase family metal-dependent hydrolase